MIKKIANRTTPLCFLPSGKLVCYKDGNLLVYCGDILESIHPIISNCRETIFGKSQILFRLLRLGVRTAIAIDEDSILLSIGCSLFEYSIKQNKLLSSYSCNKGVRPLIFTSVKNVIGFDDGIYFGSYQDVRSSSPVHIFKRKVAGQWDIVYTFELGFVEHVHSIIQDSYRNCIWVFTGDFGDNAAIWKVTDNFKKVERAFYGSQKFRACSVNVLPEGLLYATDSPLDDNYIILLNPDTGVLKETMPISGSCIYGCKWGDKYVFESSVEPSGIYKSKLHFLFCSKKGPGIKDRFVRIYCGNLQSGFSIIFKEKKDYLPYASFQFGAVKFPTGENQRPKLYFQPIATRNNDLKLMSIVL